MKELIKIKKGVIECSGIGRSTGRKYVFTRNGAYTRNLEGNEIIKHVAGKLNN